MNSLTTYDDERFRGFADQYDEHRPQPPQVLTEILSQLAGSRQPSLVVDLGSGTGLSTFLWVGRADRVIGIEPTEDMRRQAELGRQEPAEQEACGTEIAFRGGFSDDTGIEAGSADIVVASQAFHWMPPESTLAEVARILRPGGVFAAIDCDWPPVMDWQAEAAYTAFVERTSELQRAAGHQQPARWPKEQHLQSISDSGHFRYVREILLHSAEVGGAERLVGLALSQGGVQALLKTGCSPEEAGVPELEQVGREVFGDGVLPWYFSYRVRLGVR